MEAPAGVTAEAEGREAAMANQTRMPSKKADTTKVAIPTRSQEGIHTRSSNPPPHPSHTADDRNSRGPTIIDTEDSSNSKGGMMMHMVARRALEVSSQI